MSDILDSGTWAELGPAAKALYPVLCKFSNHTFKEVWPGTEELLRLTGFKTKKSLQEAKRELTKAGLIHVMVGTGRTSSRYYFRFDYKKSQVDIHAHREKSITGRGVAQHHPGGDASITVPDIDMPPNQINIHINKLTQTTNHNNPDLSQLLNEFFGNSGSRGNFKDRVIQEMLEKYGSPEVGEAIRIAIMKGKDGDIRYLEGILKNRDVKVRNSPKEPENLFASELISDSLKIWQQHLEPMGKHEGTWYFSAKSDLSPAFVEEQFRRAGIAIKVLKASGASPEPEALRMAIN